MHKLTYRKIAKPADGADNGSLIVSLALTGASYALGHVVAEIVIGYFLEIQFCMFSPSPSNPVQHQRLIGQYIGDVFFESGIAASEWAVIFLAQILIAIFGKMWPTPRTARLAFIAGGASDAVRWAICVAAFWRKVALGDASDWLVAILIALAFAFASQKRKWV